MALGAPFLAPRSVRSGGGGPHGDGTTLTAAYGTVPMMELRAFTPLHPALRSSARLPELTALIAEELSTGGTSGGFKAVAAEVGGSLDIAPYGAGLLWTLSVLDDVWEDIVRQFVDRLRDPRPAGVSASAIDQVAEETGLAGLDHQSVAAAEVRTMLYGLSGGAGRSLPDVEGLPAAAEMLDGRPPAGMLDLGDALLVAVGRVPEEDSGPVLDRAVTALRAGTRGGTTPSAPVTTLPSAQGHHRVLHVGGGDTACLRLAWPAPRRTHPDHASLFLAGHLLGGAYRSRLMRRFRGDLQWSYSPWSVVRHEPRHSLLEVNVEVPAEHHERALTLLAAEVASLAAGPLPEEELRKGIGSAAGAMASAIGSQSGMAASLIHGLVLGLPASWLWDWPTELAEVNGDQVRAAAARWLRPECAVGVTVLPG